MPLLRRALTAVAGVAGFVLLAVPVPAAADSGQLSDPTGDYPDIVSLTYDNARSTVRMWIEYDDITLAQNQSFYLSWGTTGKRYQVFDSPSAGIRELRYYKGKSAAGMKVPCSGLKVIAYAKSDRTAAAVPRSCLPKAPDRLRFQGIATAGVGALDETKKSAPAARG